MAQKLDRRNPAREFHSIPLYELEAPTRPSRYTEPSGGGDHKHTTERWSSAIRGNASGPFAKALKAKKQTIDFTERGTPNFVKLMNLNGNNKNGRDLYPFKHKDALLHEKTKGAGGDSDKDGGRGEHNPKDSSLLKVALSASQVKDSKLAQLDEHAEKVDVMALLNHEKLGSIKQAWTSKDDDALTLIEFVDVMSKYLPIQQIGEVKLAAMLCQFFDDVDVNGDGSMDWNEFTNHIIDAGMSNDKAAAVTGSDAVIDEFLKSPVTDRTQHDAQIQKVTYLEKLDHLMVFEQGHSGRVLLPILFAP